MSTTTNEPLRVLVVDDSAVMRELLRETIQSDPGLQVVGAASNGREALDMLAACRPDAVTLDVQMPMMDGLDALEGILTIRPTPVIMVSSLTGLGAKITFDALDRGAVDCVLKPDGTPAAQEAFRTELLRKLRGTAGMDIYRLLAIRHEWRKRRRALPLPLPTPLKKEPSAAVGVELMTTTCVASGISTGGPAALSVLFETVRPPLPPLVVVQHMPPRFTGPLAARLDSLSALSVKEAESNDELCPNGAWIAPAGRHLRLRRIGGVVRVVLDDGPPQSGHRPAVDVMMISAAKVYGPRCLGVIMTGMGRDGVEGCAAIRKGGGFVLGQDQATSDVYGMNKAAFVAGHVNRQFALGDVAASIAIEVQRLKGRAPARAAAEESGE